MTNQQLYDLILVKARRAGDLNLRAVIFAEMRGLLNGWERSPFHPWFLQKFANVPITNGASSVACPDDFLLLEEDSRVWFYDTETLTKTLLRRSHHEDLEVASVGVTSGTPTHYDQFYNSGDYIYFGTPVNKATYALTFNYFASTVPPPDDTAAVSNPWALNAEDLLVYAVAERLVREYVKDYKHADELAAKVAQLRADLHKYNEARKHVDMDYAIDR